MPLLRAALPLKVDSRTTGIDVSISSDRIARPL